MASTPAPSSTRPSQPPSGVVRAVESLDHDSGVIDLAMAQAADPQAAQRATTTPLAAAGLFDEDPASERGSQPPVSQRISVPPASSGAHSGSMPIAAASQSSVAARDAQPVRVVVPGKEEGEKKRGVVMLLGGLIAASAVAAGAFFFVQHNRSGAPMASVAAPVSQPEVVVPPLGVVAAGVGEELAESAEPLGPSRRPGFRSGGGHGVFRGAFEEGSGLLRCRLASLDRRRVRPRNLGRSGLRRRESGGAGPRG